MAITEQNKRVLYNYIYGIIKAKGCYLIRMNGIPNHIHLLVDLSPEISLSNFMRDLKRSSSLWLKENKPYFPRFDGWGKEYYAYSCSARDKEAIKTYIKNQEVHHRVYTFDEEMSRLSIANDTPDIPLPD